MKTSLPNNRRGIALVVVLVFLVLLSVFVVGFFSNSQDELTAAQSFTGEVSASHLAESAVSVVMGQIRESTGRLNGAWGSQPGMIRVYRDGDKASSKADAFFKLYSSDDMIISGKEIDTYDPANDVVEGPKDGWNHVPALWTDLNEFVTVQLPDPSGKLGGKVTNVPRYPILDPSLDQKVEGLELNLPVGSKADRDSSSQRARMPVRWLYVLKDGTLTAPSASEADGTRATWKENERAPTAANPIVGRVAFWTDDESSKININTAGGFSLKGISPPTSDGPRDRLGAPYTEDTYAGSFWDTPRVLTSFDRGELDKKLDSQLMDTGGLGTSQPTRGEFQRYPGHPSTTSLGIVFRGTKVNRNSPAQNMPYLLSSGQLALLAPRLQYTFDTDPTKKERGSNFGTDRLIAKFDDAAGPRVKRLYASVDELFYAQPNTADQKNDQRIESDVDLDVKEAKGVITPDLLEKMRFFLTAHSRSPEMNLFGRPRITIWPVAKVSKQEDESNLWNASDRLLAFCSTIGPDASKQAEDKVTRFIFQRNIEGTNSTTGAYDPTRDIELSRNKDLIKYLREVTGNPFPGFGGLSFESKYKNVAFGGDQLGRDQVLVEIFDYIRCVNLRDSTRDKGIITFDSYGIPRPTAKEVVKSEQFKFAPRGLVVPSKLGDRVGFGRFPSISEASLVLYHSGYQVGSGATKKRYFLKSEIPKGEVETHNLVRAFVIFETFNPMQGFAPTLAPHSASKEQRKIVFEVTGMEAFQINGTSLNFLPTATNSYKYSSGNTWGGRNSGGSEGFIHPMRDKGGEGGGTTQANWYPFQSQPDPDRVPASPNSPWSDPTTPSGVAIPKADTEMKLTGTDLNVTIGFGTGVVGQTPLKVHTLTLKFPPATVPVPKDMIWFQASGTLANGQPNGEPAGTPDVADTGDPGGFIPNLGNRWWGANPPRLPSLRQVKSLAGRMAWIGDGNSNNGSSPPAGVAPSPNYTNRWRQILQPGDVVRSVVFGKGDLRASCLTDSNRVFTTHPDYLNSTVFHAQTLRRGDSAIYYSETKFGNIAQLQGTTKYPAAQSADLPHLTHDGAPFNGVFRSTDLKLGDFDTGIGNLADGPFCNKADEGNVTYRTELYYWNDATPPAYVPYNPKRFRYEYPYFVWSYEDTYDTFFTPNRQVPSAVLFGSLPSGKDVDWQTLCFSPNPAGDSHPGRNVKLGPKDYLWLDLFTMPVVEPYAISEPFSTAGKINMNYQIVPFNHIKRSTGMRAALQPVRVTAIPEADVATFKTGSGTETIEPKWPIPKKVSGKSVNYRYVVDRDETLKAFDAFFDVYSSKAPIDPDKDDDPTNKNKHHKGFFKTAAQICDFYLYPRQDGKPIKNTSWTPNDTSIKNWWSSPGRSEGQNLTGDNVREKPYADLYPRLTTKSNTFCVHVRAQSLRQSAPSDPKKADAHYRAWDEKKDRVIGEYRGSSIIERYIDPQDERFSNTADRSIRIDVDTAKTLDDTYRFRVLGTKRFDP